MYNFDNVKSDKAMAVIAREDFFNELFPKLVELKGEENVSQIGSANAAVCVCTIDDNGFPIEICAEISVKIREFRGRTTASGKEIEFFDRLAEAEAYQKEREEKERKEREKEEKKKKQIEKAKKAREKNTK